MKEENRVLDIKEAVAFFDGHISEHMIRQMVHTGEIPHFRQGNKKLLFDAEALKLWWDNRIKQSVKPEAAKGNEYGKLRKITL